MYDYINLCVVLCVMLYQILILFVHFYICLHWSIVHTICKVSLNKRNETKTVVIFVDMFL